MKTRQKNATLFDKKLKLRRSYEEVKSELKLKVNHTSTALSIKSWEEKKKIINNIITNIKNLNG